MLQIVLKKKKLVQKLSGKSLIIVTGMRLRLGISLPCVDVILHMDPIVDVDTIYQSMFRVLTENKNKKEGYFVDMISDRCIKFLYQYDSYTNKGKKNKDVESKKKRFTETIYNMNLNGISSFKEDTQTKTIYNDLIKKLKLDSIQSFAEEVETTQENKIVEVLESLNKSLINELYMKIDNTQLIMMGKQPTT